MSVWSTRSLSRDLNYVVMQHPLKGVNYMIQGIRFRDSYAVVEKDSKTYYFLKKVPMFRAAKEFPLTHLRNLKFITRTQDIKAVYGEDVYRKFLREEEELLSVIKEETHIADTTKCQHRTVKGDLCSYPALEGSPAHYCKAHILNDPGIPEVLNVEVPNIMSKNQRKKLRNKVIEDLQKLSK